MPRKTRDSHLAGEENISMCQWKTCHLNSSDIINLNWECLDPPWEDHFFWQRVVSESEQLGEKRLPAGSSDQPDTEPFPKMTKCHSDVGFLDLVSTTVMPPADITAHWTGCTLPRGIHVFNFLKRLLLGCGLTKDL